MSDARARAVELPPRVLERDRASRKRELRLLERGADVVASLTLARIGALPLPPCEELGWDHAITFAPRSAR